MKHILCTGCSFTKNVRFNPDAPFNQGPEDRYSWPYYLQKELGDDVLVYNLGGATNDNVSMCRIIFYWIGLNNPPLHRIAIVQANLRPRISLTTKSLLLGQQVI